MQMPPYSVLASWPTPNYIDPVVRGPANIIIISIFFPLVLLTVGIRIYTRLCLSKSFGVDDWFIIATLVRKPFSIHLYLLRLTTTVSNYSIRYLFFDGGATLQMGQTYLGRRTRHHHHRAENSHCKRDTLLLRILIN